jgi:hypothetical protein
MDASVAVERYFAAWNEQKPDRRLGLVREAWHADGRYVDPIAQACGHDAISDMIGAVHAKYPRVALRVGSVLDAHHDVVRFVWEIVGEDDTVALAGLDVAHFSDDGRIDDVRGFFGVTVDTEVLWLGPRLPRKVDSAGELLGWLRCARGCEPTPGSRS